MKKVQPIEPLLAGVAGEYFVAAELSRLGYIASISLRNTRGIDILATNRDGMHSITIQCKTNQLARKSWILNEKSEKSPSKNHFYVFVILTAPNERPIFHIVPGEIVAERIASSHRRWLNTAGRNGRKRNDSTMRKFSDLEDEFLERWDLLGL